MTADEIKARLGLDSFAQLLEDLGATVNRKTHRSTCPAHNGDNPDALHYDQQGDAVLWKCFTAEHGGTAIDLVMEARGIDFGPAVDWIAENHFGERRSEPPPRKKRTRTETVRTRYEIRDMWSTLIATHIRIDFSDGTKEFPWERDGTMGLKGLSAADLPLYNSEKVEAAGLELAVFIAEGEKAADALTDHSLMALGTVCGAASTPSPAVLGLLACRHVHLWPDNDDAGQRHMEAIAKSIRPVVASLRWIKWNEVPKGDAADFFKTHTTADLDRLTFDDERDESTLRNLLDETATFVRRFVVMTPAEASVVALWTFHTHAADAADTTLFLSVTSAEKRSGKTRLFEVLELIVRNAWRTMFPTEAVVFRKIHAECPTLLLDEVDAIFGEKASQHEGLRSILNAGNRRGVTVDRCVGKGSEMKLESFDVWCPRALGGIGRLPATVADRSIPIRLKRRAQGEPIEPFRRREVEPEADVLRTRLEIAAASAIDSLRLARPVAPGGLDDRTADGAEPLLAIADRAGGEWPQRARWALLTLAGSKALDDESLGLRMLGDCRTIFDEKTADRLTTADLLKSLIAIEDSPWPEGNHGKPLTARRLATLLNPYGIVSGTIRFEEATAKGYYRSAFEDAWSRYLPLSPQNGPENVTTSQGNTGAGSTAAGRDGSEVVTHIRGSGESTDTPSLFPPESVTTATASQTTHENINTGAGCDVVTDTPQPERRRDDEVRS